jgi:phosphoribosyl 1,2-cyclic phosphodiesterase
LADNGDFLVRFWGVRGSIACPGPETVRYGGNTSCLEVRCGDRLLILDAGTGLRRLGMSLMGNGPIDADMLFTHTHFDHIAGLPFFGPMFSAKNSFRLWAGHLQPEQQIETVLCEMMMAPLFPIPMEVMAAAKTFNDFPCGDTLSFGPDIKVRTAPLNHPNRATAYRVEYGGRSVCYVTDTEHVGETLDENILALIEGTDYFVYDSTYTDDEYPAHVGWGHSTWRRGVALAEAASVGTYIVFHHDPSHDDNFMDVIAAEVAGARPGSIVAHEGLTLKF